MFLQRTIKASMVVALGMAISTSAAPAEKASKKTVERRDDFYSVGANQFGVGTAPKKQAVRFRAHKDFYPIHKPKRASNGNK